MNFDTTQNPAHCEYLSYVRAGTGLPAEEAKALIDEAVEDWRENPDGLTLQSAIDLLMKQLTRQERFKMDVRSSVEASWRDGDEGA